MERFFEFFPYGRVYPDIFHTSGSVVHQAWEEICLVRHRRPSPSGAPANAALSYTAPLVDQARSYFLTAVGSEWRSAGVVYYYSFLNLAKALLGIKGVLTLDHLRNTPLNHGLSAVSQSSPDLMDFEFLIHPPRNAGGEPHNVFALLYEEIAGQRWPFSSAISVTLGQITGYCVDIGTALSAMYEHNPRAIPVESLGRRDGSNVWFEMLVPSGFEAQIVGDLPLKPNVIPAQNVDTDTKSAWFTAYHIPDFAFNGDKILLQFDKVAIDGATYQQAKQNVMKQMDKAFNGKVEVLVYDDDHRWIYVQGWRHLGETLPWHPLLSDYLFAFVLGTVVRYQPFLVVPGEKSFALGESWCRQSPITVLRYFLMRFADKPMRIKSVG